MLSPSTPRPAALGIALLVACSLVWLQASARSESSLSSISPQLFGPCSAPAFSPQINSGPNNTGDMRAAVPAQFDADPPLDLAVLWTQSVSVLKGDTHGHFSEVFRGETPERAGAIAAADLNADTRTDVVYTLPSDTIVVRSGDGAGTLGPPSNYIVGCTPVDVAARDMTADSTADVVVSCANADPLANSGELLVLAGDASGTLGSPARIALAARPGALTIADLNGDGRRDVVVASPNENSAWIALADSNGVLTLAGQRSVGGGPRDVLAADINADGIPDLLTANELTHDVSVLMGSGDGSFGPYRSVLAGEAPVSVATADVNGDGRVDLAVADASAHVVAVLLGDGTGNFGQATNFSTADENGPGPLMIEAADLNGDERPDLVAANGGNGSYSASVTARVNFCDVPLANVELVSIVPDRDPVPFNELVTHAVVIRNTGPDTAGNAVVRVQPDAEFVSITATQGTCRSDDRAHPECALGDLTAGAIVTLWVTERATNTGSAGLWAQISSDTLDPNEGNNGWSVTTGVLAVGGLEINLSLFEYRRPYPVIVRWNPGSLQKGFYVGRWVDGVAAPLLPRLNADAGEYWDRYAVPGTLNCYFVVAMDDLGSLGHSHTLCVIPDGGSGSDHHWKFGVKMGPNGLLAKLTWEVPFHAVTVLLAVPMVDGATARWTTYPAPGEPIQTSDDTAGVNTCYMVFALGPEGTVSDYTQWVCAIPGSTVAPRGTATAGNAAMPKPVLDLARLRTAVEQTKAWLASRR